jgi:hypothetical protein
MMKTLFINKLSPTYKNFVLSQDPDLLYRVTNTARGVWKQKNITGCALPKIQNLTMCPLTSDIHDTLQQLPDTVRNEYIMSIRNKRSNQFLSNSHDNYSGQSINNQNTSNNGQAHKIRAKRRTNYQQVMKLPHVGFATKKRSYAN